MHATVSAHIWQIKPTKRNVTSGEQQVYLRQPSSSQVTVTGLRQAEHVYSKNWSNATARLATSSLSTAADNASQRLNIISSGRLLRGEEEKLISSSKSDESDVPVKEDEKLKAALRPTVRAETEA